MFSDGKDKLAFSFLLPPSEIRRYIGDLLKYSGRGLVGTGGPSRVRHNLGFAHLGIIVFYFEGLSGS